jgi:hypothetical protein
MRGGSGVTADDGPRVEADRDRGLVLVALPVTDARRLALRLLREAGKADRRQAG